MHNYADAHGTLPPAAVCGKDVRPLLSWRVLILPYIEDEKLFREFHLNEPWDSAHNIRLLDRMPKSYAANWTRYVKPPPNHTVVHVFVGSGAAFETCEPIKLEKDFSFKYENTLLLVEAGDPVPWTKPEDIVYDPTKPIRVRGLFRDGFRAHNFGHRQVFVRHDIGEEELHRMIKRNGGGSLPTNK